MKRGDFKNVSKENIQIAHELIRLGCCTDRICNTGNCPFDPDNLVSAKSCIGRYAHNVPVEESDELMVESCKEFLKLSIREEEMVFLNPMSDESISFLLTQFDFFENNFRCLEELAELSQSISKVLRKKDGARDNLVEEMADVMIVMKMLQQLHKVSDDELSEEISKKMERNLKRRLTKIK